jgi:hypothetical protein
MNGKKKYKTNKNIFFNKIITLNTVKICAVLLIMLLLTNCTGLNLRPDNAEDPGKSSPAITKSNVEPYFPTDFKEILIPAELQYQRDESITVKTDSFNGGILKFSGRVDVNSLTDFFLNSMHNNGWSLSGSVNHKKTLLIFNKMGSNCMVTITGGRLGGRTMVEIYISQKSEK